MRYVSHCSGPTGHRTVPTAVGEADSHRRWAGRYRGVSAGRMLLAIAVCVMFCGCTVMNDPEPTSIGWWGASAASSEKSNDEDHRSWFMSWLGPRRPPRPATVNEWMDQTTPVRP